MRLTRHIVKKVRRTITTATGDPWIDIGGDLGHGTRYISRTRQHTGFGGTRVPPKPSPISTASRALVAHWRAFLVGDDGHVYAV